MLLFVLLAQQVSHQICQERLHVHVCSVNAANIRRALKNPRGISAPLVVQDARVLDDCRNRPRWFPISPCSYLGILFTKVHSALCIENDVPAVPTDMGVLEYINIIEGLLLEAEADDPQLKQGGNEEPVEGEVST